MDFLCIATALAMELTTFNLSLVEIEEKTVWFSLSLLSDIVFISQTIFKTPVFCSRFLFSSSAEENIESRMNV